MSWRMTDAGWDRRATDFATLLEPARDGLRDRSGMGAAQPGGGLEPPGLLQQLAKLGRVDRGQVDDDRTAPVVVRSGVERRVPEASSAFYDLSYRSSAPVTAATRRTSTSLTTRHVP
jgi:hypothetical protein